MNGVHGLHGSFFIMSKFFYDCILGPINKTPEKLAFRFVEKNLDKVFEWSYEKLYRQVAGFSDYLFRNAFQQSTIILAFASGPKFIKSFLGCLASGNIPVAISIKNLKQSEQRLKALIEIAKPSAIVVDTQFLNFHQESINQLFKDEAIEWINIDDIGSESCLPSVVLKDLPAFYQFTSGSTSTPKGVIISHDNIIVNCWQATNAGYGKDSICASWLPCYHDMGLIGSICAPLYWGTESTLINLSAFIQNPRIWLEVISAYNIVASSGPDFGYRRCIEKVNEIKGLDLSSWVMALSGAEPVSYQTLEFFSEKFAPCGFKAQVITSVMVWLKQP